MRIAIFGVGQLARMMAHAAKPLGIECCFIGSSDEGTACVDGLGDIVNRDDYESAEALYTALGKPQVLTVEKEDVPVNLLRELQAFCEVHPNPDAVAVTQHRGLEKNHLKQNGIATTRFETVEQSTDLGNLPALTFPLFAKSMTSGYDGKHQWRINDDSGFSAITQDFPEGGVILEEMVNFSRELSFIGVRNTQGEFNFYPAIENLHHKGILVRSTAPAADVGNELQETAQSWLQTLMDDWNYVGVLTMECFETVDGLLVNELAPRVHNSGHWTMPNQQQKADTALCSQFENHMRAISGMDLGSTDTTRYYGMVNVLGDFNLAAHRPMLEETASDFHWYQKTPKPRRKLGHINCQNSSAEHLQQTLDQWVSALHPDVAAEHKA